MKRVVRGTTGQSTSLPYIKSQLFDYLADFMLEIDGEPAKDVADRIYKLRPLFDVDDVISKAIDEGIGLVAALAQLEDEAANM